MKASSQSAAPKPLLWGLALLGGYFALSGFASYFVQRNAAQWPVVDGEIRRAEVVNENDYYFVQLQYAYTVDGVEFSNDDVYLNSGIGGISVSSETMGAETRAEAEAIRDAYSIGQRVSVHYQPGDPQRAALRFETTGMLVIACFGAVIALVGILPLRFPSLFRSARERVAEDSKLRFGRQPIVFRAEELGELASRSVTASGDPTSSWDSILDASRYNIACWRPGDRVEFSRRDGGLMSRKPVYQVGFDWPTQGFSVGPEGATESIPFASIDELRIHGVHEVRQRSGGRSGGSHSYEAWDVWLDAIVGSRRIRLISRDGYDDPDRAFCDALRAAAPLAMSLNKPLRWVGFEGHAEYCPPRIVPSLSVAAEVLPSDHKRSPTAALKPARSIGPTVHPETSDPLPRLSGHTGLPPSKPPKTRISMELSDERIQVNLPRWRRMPDLQGLGIAVVVGGFAAMVSPAALADADWAPRVFVGLLWVVPLVFMVQTVRQWARTGAMEASRDRLTVTVRGLFGSRRDRWSVGDLLTICVVPSGKERSGLPIEELAVISAAGESKRYFSTCSNRELAWIAQSFRQFLGFPEPPAVTQSDPDKAVLEVSRGIVNRLHQQMGESLEDMQQSYRRAIDSGVDSNAPVKVNDIESQLLPIATELSETAAHYSQSKIDAIRAEFGLIEFDTWKPGEVVRYRYHTLDTKTLWSNAMFSGFGTGFVLLFVVPFAIPILGAILVIPVDLIGSKLLHYVIADLMAFGTGLIAWIITGTLLAIAWIAIKLDAAFAPREIDWDWRQRRLTIRSRHDTQVFGFGKLRQVNIREVNVPGEQHPLFRMEAQFAGRTVTLLEADESDEIAGLAEPSIACAERVRALAAELTRHLDVQVHLAEPVVDRFNAVGYPRDARLRDMRTLWKNVSGRTRTMVWVLVVVIVTYWTFRFVTSYQANAELLDAIAAESQNDSR
jgi:hypothetical protein